MDDTQKKMVETYQCPGCVCGSDISCFEPSNNLACGKHIAGTTISPVVGRIFLGLPKGFCRFLEYENAEKKSRKQIAIFNEFPTPNWEYDKFNVPVWKHLDEHGNTLVRGMCPRLDYTWIHIFVGDQSENIKCLDILPDDIDEMD